MNTENNALHKLENKLNKLQAIIASNPPTNPVLQEAHDRKVSHAKSFRDELMVVCDMVGSVSTIRQILLVPRPTFERAIQRADFSTIEFDGIYAMVCEIVTYPNQPYWIVWTAPFDVL